jgi:glucokinase
MAASIGIDLGATQVRAARVEDGVIVKRASMRTDVAGGPRSILGQFDALIDEIDGFENVLGVGICAPGPLDSVRGEIIHIPTLPGWEGFPLKKAYAEHTGLPVWLENDAVAATYGEWKFGAGKGLDNLVYVTVSTGIGGGAVVDGRLLHGRRGMVGHVGHFQFVED